MDRAYVERLLKQKKKEFFKSDGEKRKYKIPEDTTPVTLRVLPPYKTKDGFAPIAGRFVSFHFGIPARDPKDPKFLLCYRTWGLECGVCNELQKWSTRGVEIKTWDSKETAMMNILVIDDQTKQPSCIPKVPYIFQARTNDLTWLLEQMLDPQVGDLTDPKTGANVIFTREKHNGKIKRAYARMATPIAPTDEEINAILSQMYNFDDMYRQPDDEKHRKYLEGIETLRGILENRAMTTPQPNSPSPPMDYEIPFGQPSNAPQQQRQQASPPRAGIPPGAPECFGNTTAGLKDSRGDDMHIYDADHKKCVMCYKSFDCETAIKARG